MDETRIGLEPDLVARLELMALAKHGDDVLVRQLRDHLDLGAGRLDHLDLGLGAVIGEGEMLGPDAAHDAAPIPPRGRGERQAQAPRPFELREAVGAHRAAQKIHRRRADEAGDEQIVRPVVELERRADLLDQAVVHHHDLVRHRHGLDLVVRDVDRGGPEALMQLLDLGAHLHAELGVEIGERLVEQKHLRIAHDGAAHGDALALTAGQLPRKAREQMGEAQNLGRALHPRVGLRLAGAAQAQRKAHIGRDRAQQRRLAAARWTDQDDELPVVDRDVDAVNDLCGPERLAHLADRDRRHMLPLAFFPSVLGRVVPCPARPAEGRSPCYCPHSGREGESSCGLPAIRECVTKPLFACLVFAAIFAFAPAVLAEDKPAVPQFQVEPFWPKPLPNNWILGQVSGIAADRFDRIWVVHRRDTLNERERAAEQNPPTAKCCVAAPPVLLFDQSGNLLKSWGGPGPGYEWPKSEHGIFVDDNDFVWLAGNGKQDGQLLKFTVDGKFVLQIGRAGPIRGSNDTTALGSPADVAVDVAARAVFAADGHANRRVVVFDSETGAYKRHWGAYGNRPSDAKTERYDPAKPPSQQFGNPVHCIRLAKDGLLYVCDRSNDRLQVFRRDGTFVSEHIFEKN